MLNCSKCKNSLLGVMQMEATYIVYDDKERILTVGTAKEVAEYLGIGITSVYTLSSDLKRGIINPKIKIYSVRGI
ncbi:hypothetical protein B6U49_03190 [Ligilactobacillus salivarius]|uniref:Uncharacterized protein n=2 Tax=Ligilactobacillus salivarius TaxID=1624 RepID=A0A2U2M7I7_9LACO|nr:hypothetical protein CR249_00335 [Ligilactobacillus salivarius]OQR05140.1 hypothetical protein B6U49_03190 [Ligilactobacillus salivarius]PLA92850.1 hypothetical protein CYR84_07000 [Ligilactobacillus salivarius]PWG52822.1 hypothetical protein DB362_02570 [Ligilactobacillus salivarius]